MLAAVKFFLGQDEREENDEDEDAEEAKAAVRSTWQKLCMKVIEKASLHTLHTSEESVPPNVDWLSWEYPWT
eukprot:scaffold81344_cov35-Prasinocladus_malaysianus.AAC.1